MIDTLLAQLPATRELDMPGRLGLPRGECVVVTLHRPSNVDDPAALSAVLSALERIARERPAVFPVHPRTRARNEAFGVGGEGMGIRMLDPLGYREMLSLTEGAAVV